MSIPDYAAMRLHPCYAGYGSKLVLTEAAKGMKGAVAKAEEIAAAEHDRKQGVGTR